MAASRSSFFQLSCREPFRVFFPLGVLIALSGVSLWPLYFGGLHKFYPGLMHARMMIEGFLAAFVLGFLGTAAPRLTGTAHFSAAELRSLLGLFIGAVAAQIAERPVVGDAIFLALLVFFVARLGWRFAQRRELPPPGFVLVAFGFLHAIAGVALLIVGESGPGYPYATLLGTLLLYQGWVLHLVLGISAFLLPRFLGVPPRPEADDLSLASAAWKQRALLAAGASLGLLGSFVVEGLLLSPRTAGALRFLTSGLFLLTEIPVRARTGRSVTLTRGFRVALVLMLLGLFFPVLWPWQRVAGLHLVFIGGFTLITLTVATRVVLGHSGHPHLFTQSLPFLRYASLLLVVAAVFRVLGDFFPVTRGRLLDTASYLWMLAAALWAWRVLPKVRIADPESIS